MSLGPRHGAQNWLSPRFYTDLLTSLAALLDTLGVTSVDAPQSDALTPMDDDMAIW